MVYFLDFWPFWGFLAILRLSDHFYRLSVIGTLWIWNFVLQDYKIALRTTFAKQTLWFEHWKPLKWPQNGLKMAAMDPKMVKIFRNFRILNIHTFLPQLTNEIVRKLIFLHKMLYFVDFWPFWGFLAIFTPFQSLDHSEIEILAHRALKSRYEKLLLNKLFDSSTGKPSNGLKMALKWPSRVQKWPKFSETLES